MRGLVAVVLAMGLPGQPAFPQTQTAVPPYRVEWWDAASIGAAGALYLLPIALGLPHGGPSCAPCDPATLPGIDRWAVGSASQAANVGSSVVLAGVGAGAAWLGLAGLPSEQWRGNFATFANTASWTAASTEWLKVLIHRKRPALYTSDAAVAAADRDNEQSFPSMHTSLAFAAATSYAVMSRRERLPHHTRNALLLYAGALGVGGLRVAAGKHFPTDVMVGAALGSVVGWLVPTIHPTTRP